MDAKTAIDATTTALKVLDKVESYFSWIKSGGPAGAEALTKLNLAVQIYIDNVLDAHVNVSESPRFADVANEMCTTVNQLYQSFSKYRNVAQLNVFGPDTKRPQAMLHDVKSSINDYVNDMKGSNGQARLRSVPQKIRDVLKKAEDHHSWFNDHDYKSYL